MVVRSHAEVKGMDRRDFLKLAGSGVAAAALLPACGGFSGSDSGGGSNTVLFSHGPDDSGTVAALVDQFNKKGNGFKVQWREQAADTGVYFDTLKTQFQAGGGDIDVISGDVIWPAQFGFNGWVDDLSDLFDEQMQSEFLSGPIEAVTYNGKVYAVPWFTDAGMFYYRKDLMAKAGLDPNKPPSTWDEVASMANKITKSGGAKLGLVFQGDQYEGGVCNGAEFIWGAGGNILSESDQNKVIVDSPESATGLDTEASMVTSGAAPEAVVTYQEPDCQTAYLNGTTAFMRNWPYMVGLIAGGKETGSKIKPGQVGVTALPRSEGGDQGYSTLGGWNLFINSASDKKEQSWEFIKFLASPEAAKMRALKGGFLSPLKATYEDKAVVSKVPSLALAKSIADRIRSRPVSPFYSDLSLEMQEQFNAAVKGEQSGEETVATLQSSMQEIIDKGLQSQ